MDKTVSVAINRLLIIVDEEMKPIDSSLSCFCIQVIGHQSM